MSDHRQLQRKSGPPKGVAGWERQEEAAAKVHRGRRTRGSGCTQNPHEKGDVVGEVFRVENKSTAGKRRSITIKRDDLTKIKAEAETVGQSPVLVFGWDETAMSEREDWHAFPARTAECLVALVLATLAGDTETAREQAERIRDQKV